MTAVDHEMSGEVISLQLRLGLSYALRIEVGSLLSATEDNEAIRVADGADNSDNTRLGDGQEVVRMFDRANGINGYFERPVGTVLESDREG